MIKVKTNHLLITGLKIVVIFFFCVPCNAFSGKYLSANFARVENDFKEVATNYSLMIQDGALDYRIIQDAIVFSVLSSKFSLAEQVANFVSQGENSIPARDFFQLAAKIKSNDFDKVVETLENDGKLYPDFVKTLLKGWIELARNNFEKGVDHFSTLSGDLDYLASYNYALAYAFNQKFDKAANYLNKIDFKRGDFNDKQLLAVIQIYSNNGQNDQAVKLLSERIKKHDELIFFNSIAKLRKGETLKFNSYINEKDALADVFYLMGTVGFKEKESQLTYIFYLQLAKFISQSESFYKLKLAEVMNEIDAQERAIEAFNNIDEDSDFYLKAQVQLGATLMELGNETDAIKIHENLIEANFQNFQVFSSLANMYRMMEKYDQAVALYSLAVAENLQFNKEKKWLTYFLRGISYDRLGDWEAARKDFEASLIIYPDHPEVLNYLGYSLIEKNESLVEALEMIELAIDQRPRSGYIIDSLAWALFKLGRYEESIVYMEKAIELEPHDPIVNDHLGDVLWMIGRKREARFQWKRALLFEPTPEEVKKINKKLKEGLLR